MAARLVRDVGVAGSNPATPTIFLTSAISTGPDMGNETPYRVTPNHRAILLEHSDSVRSTGCERSTAAIKAVRLRALRRLLL